ncbi:hypothetical protein HY732_03640 [Candidatus Uhrbacteria bacterium]|nr:hypothetical protein [Candidatus Uhrbacteria bacterium]
MPADQLKNPDVLHSLSQPEQVRTPDGKMYILAVGATAALAGCGNELPGTAAQHFSPPEVSGKSATQELYSTWEGEGKNELRGTIPGTNLNVTATFERGQGQGGTLRVYVTQSEKGEKTAPAYQPSIYIVDSARNAAFMFTKSNASEHADEKTMSHHYRTPAGESENLSVIVGDRLAFSQALQPLINSGDLSPLRRIQMLGSDDTPYSQYSLKTSAVGLNLLDTLKKTPNTAAFTYTDKDNFQLQ